METARRGPFTSYSQQQNPFIGSRISITQYNVCHMELRSETEERRSHARSSGKSVNSAPSPPTRLLHDDIATHHAITSSNPQGRLPDPSLRPKDNLAAPALLKSLIAPCVGSRMASGILRLQKRSISDSHLEAPRLAPKSVFSLTSDQNESGLRLEFTHGNATHKHSTE
jgi:hypothetical protein